MPGLNNLADWMSVTWAFRALSAAEAPDTADEPPIDEAAAVEAPAADFPASERASAMSLACIQRGRRKWSLSCGPEHDDLSFEDLGALKPALLRYVALITP